MKKINGMHFIHSKTCLLQPWRYPCTVIWNQRGRRHLLVIEANYKVLSLSSFSVSEMKLTHCSLLIMWELVGFVGKLVRCVVHQGIILWHFSIYEFSCHSSKYEEKINCKEVTTKTVSADLRSKDGKFAHVIVLCAGIICYHLWKYY